jgi:hypothetical protein
LSGAAPIIEIHEPNRTVRRLMCEVLEEAGFQVRLGVAPATPALVIYDVTAQDVAAQERLLTVQEEGWPILYCGVRHQREAYASEPWLDRPFSASALLTQCQGFLPPGTLLRRVRERSGAMAAIGRDELDDDSTSRRGVSLDEASLLEVEFGLEPGVLGALSTASGRPGYQSLSSPPDDDDSPETGEIVALDDDSELIVGEEDLLMGGRLMGAPRVVALEADQLDAADGALTDRMSLRLTGGQPALAPQVALDADREPVTGPVVLPQSVEGSGELPVTAAGAALDPEAAQELRQFSRMLAEAWGKIGMTAGINDRSDRIYRVLQALLERGMDGASHELRRIPAADGFSGSLGVLSLVGLLRTVRDRELRGRLEVSACEFAWVLYLDRGLLCDIDALFGADQDRLLIDGLVAEELIDHNQAGYLLALVADEDALMGAPLELRILREGWLDAPAIARARHWRARSIFRQLCGQRAGVFAFIEIHAGDGQPWPSQELRLRVDELLLEVLREESVQTGRSEATSRTRLMPDAARIAALGPAALNDEERALLDFFRQGETLQQARLQLGQAPDEVDRLVRRLRRAELLRRSEAPAGSQPRQAPAAPAQPVSAPLAPPALRVPPSERTVITEVDMADLRRMTQEEEAHPKVGRDPHEIPTRSVKAHSMTPPDVFESVDDGEDALRELLEQAFDASLTTRSDD